jgi:hypothetical protein
MYNIVRVSIIGNLDPSARIVGLIVLSFPSGIFTLIFSLHFHMVGHQKGEVRGGSEFII